MPMKYNSPEWRAKILDAVTAINWTVLVTEHDDDMTATWFLKRWITGDVFGEEDGEYRYWATGVHEPETVTE